VDDILADVLTAKDTFSGILKLQGIEPNLETLLGYFTGYMIGLVQGVYGQKLRRVMTQEETIMLLNLLKRRAWEIRQAFMVQPID
jgi:hypothetical protein